DRIQHQPDGRRNHQPESSRGSHHPGRVAAAVAVPAHLADRYPPDGGGGGIARPGDRGEARTCADRCQGEPSGKPAQEPVTDPVHLLREPALLGEDSHDDEHGDHHQGVAGGGLERRRRERRARHLPSPEHDETDGSGYSKSDRHRRPYRQHDEQHGECETDCHNRVWTHCYLPPPCAHHQWPPGADDRPKSLSASVRGEAVRYICTANCSSSAVRPGGIASRAGQIGTAMVPKRYSPACTEAIARTVVAWTIQVTNASDIAQPNSSV